MKDDAKVVHAPGRGMDAEDFARDVRVGLTDRPKHVPPMWLYDAEGSRLFERITDTPEYYPTRTEAGILEAHARDIVDAVPDLDAIVELGAGSGRKTRIVLNAAARRWGRARYFPIDVSPTALELAKRDLEAALPDVDVFPVHGRNRDALARIPRRGHHLVMFLGSSIGNLLPDEQVAFLQGIATSLEPGDAFLLGTDMVKDPAVLHAAYNDADGVTEAFIKNLLVRMNTELGAAFDPATFRYVGEWTPAAERMELFLESLVDQEVPVPKADVVARFARGERLHVEDSHKFTPGKVAELAGRSGFTVTRSWYDADGWFGLHLMQPR